MAFLLLARSTDESLTLLSRNAFESRQDALGALSQITADPSFDAWDDDVLLIDIDAGTPVLLVRPHAAPVASTPAAESVQAEETEPAEFAAVADEGPLEVSSVEETVIAQSDQPEPVAETPAELPSEQLEPSVDIDEVARTIIAEAVAENAGEVMYDSPAAAIMGDDEGSLLEALARTAVQMEASGIVAPASIGAPGEPSDSAEVPSEPELQAESEADIEPEAGTEPEAESEPEAVQDETASPDSITDELEALAEELGVIEPEAIAGPNAEAPEHETAQEVTDSEESVETAPEPAPPAPEAPVWPWDVASETPAIEPVAQVEPDGGELPTPAEESSGVVLEGIEEPAIDAGGSLITSTVDDEAFAAARPVILGAYGDRATDIEIDDQDVVGPIDEADAIEPGEAAATAEDTDSDFILIGEQPGAEIVVAESDDAPSPLADYTCNDCVYLETCPNKDQRRPEDCGSFQWK